MIKIIYIYIYTHANFLFAQGLFWSYNNPVWPNRFFRKGIKWFNMSVERLTKLWPKTLDIYFSQQTPLRLKRRQITDLFPIIYEVHFDLSSTFSMLAYKLEVKRLKRSLSSPCASVVSFIPAPLTCQPRAFGHCWNHSRPLIVKQMKKDWGSLQNTL